VPGIEPVVLGIIGLQLSGIGLRKKTQQAALPALDNAEGLVRGPVQAVSPLEQGPKVPALAGGALGSVFGAVCRPGVNGEVPLFEARFHWLDQARFRGLALEPEGCIPISYFSVLTAVVIAGDPSRIIVPVRHDPIAPGLQPPRMWTGGIRAGSDRG